MSPATVNLWKNHKYTGDNDKISKAVKNFLEKEAERADAAEQSTNALGFVETSISRKIFEVARLCHLENELGVIYGNAGLGKTYSVKEYANHYDDVILIEADLGFTAKVLFQELHRVLGMSGTGSVHSMFDECIRKLKGSGRMIIIDEAEHLPYRALELIRRIYDKAGVGILLVGMPRLVHNLRGKKGEYAQLFSRVGVSGRLDSLRLTDTEMLVRSVLPAANGICKTYHAECHGNTRVLSKLLARSLRVARNSGVDLDDEVVRATAQMLII
jgi:DNA transposition AAA+ family ATPase